MKVSIERPGDTTFGALRQGNIFENGDGIYIVGKTDSMKATVIYKHVGHLNAGDVETFASDTKVRRIVAMNFTVG
ncbi:hypothetical protein [Aquabacterium sp.]|uniref:hypothetical protein n=1 Tax=Aquabacterium sp. TaxID=1872578 RepID=UPI0025C7309F|nr:hypothetical protein [Aquabacterium sp.]